MEATSQKGKDRAVKQLYFHRSCISTLAIQHCKSAIKLSKKQNRNDVWMIASRCPEFLSHIIFTQIVGPKEKWQLTCRPNSKLDYTWGLRSSTNTFISIDNLLKELQQQEKPTLGTTLKLLRDNFLLLIQVYAIDTGQLYKTHAQEVKTLK